MFFHGKKEIDIVEYTCSSARTPHARLRLNKSSIVAKKMEFSSIKLSVAIARTILSYDPSNLDLVFQSVSAFFNIQSIIGTKGRNLCLVDNIRDKFRDFSLSGRVGELAQALNYIFVQEILKKPLVVDFEGFLLAQGYWGLYPYKGQTPDFVVSDIGLSAISLIESKGSCPKEEGIKLKTTLRLGLEQCDKAQQYFIKNKLPINIKTHLYLEYGFQLYQVIGILHYILLIQNIITM